MASPDASGARAGETSAETAAQVTAAFRAAARARRGQHQKPVDVLRRAFASSCPGDGRASPEDFRVTATKLGLEIPVKDVLAVFDTSEHVMRDDGGKTPSRGDDAVAGGWGRTRRPRKGDFRRPPEPVPRVGPVSSVVPALDRRRAGHRPRARRGPRSGSALAAEPSPPSAPTRGVRFCRTTGRAAGAFNYPQCRTPVFAPPGWSHRTSRVALRSQKRRLSSITCTAAAPGWWTATRASRSRAFPRVPAKPPKRRGYGRARGLLESKSREECVFFAAGVGVVQTLRVDEARDDDSDSAEGTLNRPSGTSRPRGRRSVPGGARRTRVAAAARWVWSRRRWCGPWTHARASPRSRCCAIPGGHAPS